MLAQLHKLFARLSPALLLAMLCTACGVPWGSVFQHAQPTPIQAAATTLAPVLTPTPATGPLEAPGADWKTYTDAATGVSFAYPPGWKEKSSGVLEGPGGFAQVEIRANDGASTGAVCQAEANREKPRRYGAFPEIQDTRLATAPACLILPSSDQPAGRKNEALFLLWLPASVRQNALWALHADRNHIAAIVKSLHLGQAADSGQASRCNFADKTLKASSVQQNGLSIHEFPVAPAANCSPYQEAGGFNQVASAGAPAAAAAQVVNSQFTPNRLSQLNQRLAPFGYQVQLYSENLFRVVKDGKVQRSNIFWIGQLTVNTSGDDFILPIVDSYNSLTLIVRPDGIHPVEDWNLLLYDNIFPVLVGNDQISLEYDDQRIPRQTNDPALLNVKKNDRVIDTLSINGSTATRGPVRGLWAWENHWVLELPDTVVQDGQSLNDQLGYSEIFTWRLIDGKPFYFFRKDGQIHVSYAGATLPVTYDEVIHAPQSNDGLLLELKAYEGGVLFYARRGDAWYYVTLQG